MDSNRIESNRMAWHGMEATAAQNVPQFDAWMDSDNLPETFQFRK